MLFPVGKSASKKKTLLEAFTLCKAVLKGILMFHGLKGIVGKGPQPSIMSGSYRAKLPGVISQSNSLDALYAVQTFHLL